MVLVVELLRKKNFLFGHVTKGNKWNKSNWPNGNFSFLPAVVELRRRVAPPAAPDASASNIVGVASSDRDCVGAVVVVGQLVAVAAVEAANPWPGCWPQPRWLQDSYRTSFVLDLWVCKGRLKKLILFERNLFFVN